MWRSGSLDYNDSHVTGEVVIQQESCEAVAESGFSQYSLQNDMFVALQSTMIEAIIAAVPQSQTLTIQCRAVCIECRTSRAPEALTNIAQMIDTPECAT